jgi:alpha-tubulin suppressor-like RCC1 family protein
MLTDLGHLYMIGSNKKGQLGLDHLEAQGSPQLVDKLKEFQILQVSCGKDFTCAVTTES